MPLRLKFSPKLQEQQLFTPFGLLFVCLVDWLVFLGRGEVERNLQTCRVGERQGNVDRYKHQLTNWEELTKLKFSASFLARSLSLNWLYQCRGFDWKPPKFVRPVIFVCVKKKRNLPLGMLLLLECPYFHQLETREIFACTSWSLISCNWAFPFWKELWRLLWYLVFTLHVLHVSNNWIILFS